MAYRTNAGHRLYQPRSGRLHLARKGKATGGGRQLQRNGLASGHQRPLVEHVVGLRAVCPDKRGLRRLTGAQPDGTGTAAGIAAAGETGEGEERGTDTGQAAVLRQHLPRVPHAAHADHDPTGGAAANGGNGAAHTRQAATDIQERGALQGTDIGIARLPEAGTRQDDAEGGATEPRRLPAAGLRGLPRPSQAAAHTLDVPGGRRRAALLVRPRATAEGVHQPVVQRLEIHARGRGGGNVGGRQGRAD